MKIICYHLLVMHIGDCEYDEKSLKKYINIKCTLKKKKK